MRIEYVPTEGGRAVTRDLTDPAVSTTELLQAAPVRQPAFYHGQWSKPGWYWMASLDKHVSYESKFERSFLMEADYSGSVTTVVPQPLRLHFDRSTTPYRHVPDFLVEHAVGVPQLVDVKGARARSKPLNQLTFTLTGRACQQLGLAFTVYTEPDPVHHSNLAFIAGYRSKLHAVLDTEIPAVVDALEEGPLSFAVLCQRIVDHGVSVGAAPAVVWRAAWLRIVSAPLRPSPLGMTTLIELPGLQADDLGRPEEGVA